MISEKGFARGYSSFWTEYFPWLNSYCQSLNKFSITHVSEPIKELDLAEHRSINNTIAFFHYRALCRDATSNPDTSRTHAVDYISRFPRNSISSYTFSRNDQEVIASQVSNLQRRYGDDVAFNPRFSGCGILDNCDGDILQGKTLIEIKAGDRGIQAADIKQLIVYSALDWLAVHDKHGFVEIEIYNPRVGYKWRAGVDELLLSITDMPKEDVFDQLGKYLVVQSEDFEIE